MKRLVSIAIVFATAMASTCAHSDEVRACSFTVKARCASGDTRITLADGIVKRIEVNMFWCGLPGRAGYTCTIDSVRGDSESVWSDEGGAILIGNTSPWTTALPDRIKVIIGPEISIDFKETQSLGRCGAGAELPETIVIPQKGACRVQFGSP